MFLYCSPQCQARKDRQMVDKKDWKGRKALTDDLNFGDNRGRSRANAQTPDADPRIVALVRMLARKAAERDYAHYVRRNGAAHNDLPEEE